MLKEYGSFNYYGGFCMDIFQKLCSEAGRPVRFEFLCTFFTYRCRASVHMIAFPNFENQSFPDIASGVTNHRCLCYLASEKKFDFAPQTMWLLFFYYFVS